MPTRTLAAAVVTCALAVATSAAADTVRSPLHGALDPGPHRVGFTVTTVKDATRPTGPKRDASGNTANAAAGRDDAILYGGRVVLSCHSQGAVLGAATVMQLTTEQSSDVAFLTYGSPLSRLYARFFPSHFGGAALTRIGVFLTPPAEKEAEPDRACWPWRNLYRPSDPIGGHTLHPYLAVEITDAQRLADDVRPARCGWKNRLGRRYAELGCLHHAAACLAELRLQRGRQIHREIRLRPIGHLVTEQVVEGAGTGQLRDGRAGAERKHERDRQNDQDRLNHGTSPFLVWR